MRGIYEIFVQTITGMPDYTDKVSVQVSVMKGWKLSPLTGFR
ncbi:MAG: hypothetical protein ABIT58_04535 [Ferruginibacter sp.]